MKHILESIDPAEATVEVEVWTHPVREISYVSLDLSQPWDALGRNLLPKEAREVAEVLIRAADEAEAAQA